jgi:hypothetical protein
MTAGSWMTSGVRDFAIVLRVLLAIIKIYLPLELMSPRKLFPPTPLTAVQSDYVLIRADYKPQLR